MWDHYKPVIEIVHLAERETGMCSVISKVALFYMELAPWTIESDGIMFPPSAWFHVVWADHSREPRLASNKHDEVDPM